MKKVFKRNFYENNAHKFNRIKLEFFFEEKEKFWEEAFNK